VARIDNPTGALTASGRLANLTADLGEIPADLDAWLVNADAAFGDDEAGRAYAKVHAEYVHNVLPAAKQLLAAWANVSAAVHQGLTQIVDTDDPRPIEA
jgi:hypothetical protein